MIDNETIINDTGNDTPAPEPAPAPTPEPAPAPEPSPAPEPEAPAAPVEVVTVDDLLDRLTGVIQETAEGTEESEGTEGEEPAEAPEESFGGFFWGDGETAQTVDMDAVVEYLETIQQTVSHPALTTPFADYTVTEALLLLLFLSAFAAACVKMLKGGFAWLR